MNFSVIKRSVLGPKTALQRTIRTLDHRSSRVKSALWRLENMPPSPSFHRPDDAGRSDGSKQANQ